MDLHNSDFSGSPCRLQTAALSSAHPWARRQNAFYIWFLPGIRRGNTSLPVCRQSLLFQRLLLWAWLVPELYFHCSSMKIPAEPHLSCTSLRGVEVSGFYVKFRLQLGFWLVCTRSQQQKNHVQDTHTNRPTEVIGSTHVHKGGGGWVQ